MPRERIPLSRDKIVGTVNARGGTASWPRHPGQWVVYTIYDAERSMRVPLYVGVTSSAKERFKQHRMNSVWWRLSGEITLHGFYDNKADAYDAEGQQIHALQPLLNTVHNTHTGEVGE
jgi:predicted GIY-YIG superfamily endonuclease